MSEPPPSEELAELLAEFLTEEFEDQPVRATALGVEGYDDRLGDFSADAFGRRRRRDDGWLRRFTALADAAPDAAPGAAPSGDGTSGDGAGGSGGSGKRGVSGDDAIDRDLVASVLRGRAVMHDWEDWRRSPDVYLGACLYGAFYLFLHRLRPEPELVDAAVQRLSAVPAVLDHARANLDGDLANELLVRRSLGMCQAGVAYARDLLPAEVGDDRLRKRLADAGAHAAEGFADFAGFLEDLAGTAQGPFAVGEERYSALLREQEGLRFDASQLHALGVQAYDDLATEMATRADEIAGTPDFRAVIAEANRDHPSTPEEMRDLYAEWTARARDFLVERELVSFPDGERCEVVPSPHFQRPVLAVASYMRPPAFTGSRVGHFFVPFPPEDASDDDVQQRLAMNSRVIIPSISVHEAYPGHHWHLSVVAGSPRDVRKVYGTAYFAEGWGLYTEQMMREEGFFPDPRMELLQLDMRMWRAARIVVDTALHTGQMTPDEATSYMQERAGLSEPVARAEVARYCAWPTQAAAYLTGSLEIERIRERYLAERRGDLRSFHDTLAASGVLPLSLAERAVMEA